MSHHLAFNAAQDYPAPPAAVFKALQTQTPTPASHHEFGALLASKPVWGTQGEAGYQTVFRANWGVVDLEMKETICAIDPPHLLRVRQLPLRYLAFDRAERLPPVGHDAPANPDRYFQLDFGKSPAPTEIQFDLSESNSGTTLNLTIQTRLASKPGWFMRRRWRKKIPAETARIFARIETALNTA